MLRFSRFNKNSYTSTKGLYFLARTYILRFSNLYRDSTLNIYIYRVFMKYCVFSKNSRKFATSPSPALGCYWLYKKLPANRSDCTLALHWELWRSLTAMKAREGLQWIVKKHNFSWTPCTKYIQVQNNYIFAYAISKILFIAIFDFDYCQFLVCVWWAKLSCHFHRTIQHFDQQGYQLWNLV